MWILTRILAKKAAKTDPLTKWGTKITGLSHSSDSNDVPTGCKVTERGNTKSDD